MKKKIVFMMTVILFISACGSDKQTASEDDAHVLAMEAFTFERNFSTDYEVSEIQRGALSISTFSGLCSNGEEIFLSDARTKVVNKYDSKFNLVDSFSSEHFISPTLLAYDEGLLFVLDESLEEVFSLDDKSGEVLKRVSLPEKDPDSDYLDLCVEGEKLYLTYRTALFSDAHIVVVDLDDESSYFIGEDFFGTLTSDGSKVFAANSLVSYGDPGQSGFRTGENHVYEISGKELVKSFACIQGCIPSDFIMSGRSFYVYAAGWSSIDLYSWDGSYQTSLVQFEDSDLDSQMVKHEETIFLLMRDNNKLYQVKRK